MKPEQPPHCSSAHYRQNRSRTANRPKLHSDRPPLIESSSSDHVAANPTSRVPTTQDLPCSTKLTTQNSCRNSQPKCKTTSSQVEAVAPPSSQCTIADQTTSIRSTISSQVPSLRSQHRPTLHCSTTRSEHTAPPQLLSSPLHQN